MERFSTSKSVHLGAESGNSRMFPQVVDDQTVHARWVGWQPWDRGTETFFVNNINSLVNANDEEQCQQAKKEKRLTSSETLD